MLEGQALGRTIGVDFGWVMDALCARNVPIYLRILGLHLELPSLYLLVTLSSYTFLFFSFTSFSWGTAHVEHANNYTLHSTSHYNGILLDDLNQHATHQRSKSGTGRPDLLSI